MLVTGSLVLHAAVIGPAAAAFTRRTLCALGLFWVVHGGYQLLYPMPLPVRLASLQLVLVGFPAVVAILLWAPLKWGSQVH